LAGFTSASVIATGTTDVVGTALSYLARLLLAESRARWFLVHLLDLAIIALPQLRPLRLLRLVTLLDVLNREPSKGSGASCRCTWRWVGGRFPRAHQWSWSY
jgi:hypothetical protein